MVMAVPGQGDMIILEKGGAHALILSRKYFNRSGLAVVCPVRTTAPEDALHIPVRLNDYKGVALLEQLRSLDLGTRHYKTVGTVDLRTVQNVSDAVQGIFDYYPFSKTYFQDEGV